MHTAIKTLFARHRTDGRLAILANLLFDVVLAGWIAFAGLYAIEILLPTSVTARLSLVKLSVILLFLTSLLAWLGSILGKGERSPEKLSRPIILSISIIAVGIIALAHYRFPWWSIPILVASYGAALWLLINRNRERR